MKFFLILFIFAVFLFSKEVVIEVKQMHCPLCTSMVKKAIKNVEGVTKVKVKLQDKKAVINFDESKTNIATILEAIKTTSYVGEVVKP
ncbi:heavy-metal-associated domain-containing protein [Malaciobacter mytili]|uniref:heavy-metal-associated domain-containing protein n=1 Tax=Malaciobacter mytili TaxID=603050 RepID=UPI003A877ECF